MRYDFLDALRGYAILGVVAVHSTQYIPGFEETFAAGARGVQLFFVVSALTLTLAYNDGRQSDWTAFFIRRAFRILPLFWIALLFYGQGSDWITVIATATATNALSPWTIKSAVPGGWSIGVEALFYAAFPLLMVTLNTASRCLVACAIGFVAAPAATGALYLFARDVGGATSEQAFLWGSMPTWALVFALGIASAFAIKALKGKALLWQINLALAVCLIDIAAMLFRDHKNIRMLALEFAVVSVCLALGAGRILVNKAAISLGQISYGVYLTHFFFVTLLTQHQASFWLTGGALVVAMFLACLAGSVVVATIAKHLIEDPMIRLGKLVSSIQRSDWALVRREG